MQTFEEYRQIRDQSVSILHAIAYQLRVLGGASKALSVEQAAERLNRDDFRIIFCGEFKRGKSTFINAILGQKALPMKVAPCTGVITEVKYAQEPRVLVHPLRGDPFKANVDEIKQYIAIQGNDAPDVSRVELFYPIDLCKNGITLIDSPGLNEDWRRTQISLTELSQADAVIMVLSCEMALSRSEMDFIESRLLDRKVGSFFVWNRYDAVWNDDLEIAALRERSQSRLKEHQGQVYYLSAREALVAQLRGDESRFLRSGLPSFMNSLEQFLTEKRALIKLQSPLNEGKKAAQYGIHVLAPRALALLKAPLSQLQQEEVSLRPKLLELEHTRTALRELIDESIEDLLNDLIEVLDSFFGTVSQRACQDSADIQLPKAGNRQERQDFLIRWYNQWLKEALNELAKKEFAPRIQNGFSDLQEELQLERRKFHAHIQKLLQIDIDLEKTLLFDGAWKQDLPLFISTAIALLILGASSGAVAISLMGLGALRAWLTGQNIDEVERITFAQALSDTLKTKRPEFIQLIRSHLEDSCAEMRSDIDKEMKELIQDTQKQLDQAIEMRQKQEQHVQQKQTQIEDAIHLLTRLHIDLNERTEDV